MKKIKTIIIAVVLVTSLIFSGCSGDKVATEDTLDGSLKDIMTSIIDGAAESLSEEDVFPDFFDMQSSASDALFNLGLNEDEFTEYVEDNLINVAMLAVIPCELVLVKCKDIADGPKVAEMMKKGYDPQKWIETMPEVSYIIGSGSYILLFSGTAGQQEAVEKSFKDLAGGNTFLGEVFFTEDDAKPIE